MKSRTIFFNIVVVCLLLVLNSCEKKQVKKQTDKAQTNEYSGLKNTQRIAVEALIVKPKRVEQNVPLTGVLNPLHSVDIITEVSGKVSAVYKKLGDAVSTKDTLAVIDDKIPLCNYRQAKSQVLSAKINLKIAELNLKSDKELYSNGDISELTYESSKLSVKTAEANHLSALANLSLLEKNYRDTRIMSPINGLISRKNIDLGTMVTPNLPVYRVVDLTILKIEVGVPQSMISLIHVGTKAKIEISALNNQEFTGIVRYISPQADENTGAFIIEVHIQNTNDLKIRAGMTSTINLILTDNREQLVIPDYALVSKNGNNHIYKITNGIAQLTKINIDETIGSQVIVDKGLAEGDTIVVVGMKNLGVDTKVWVEMIH